MSAQLTELDGLLKQLVAEHRKLLADLDAQQAAMRRLDADAMDAATRRQEQARLRILSLETRRRLITAQLAKMLRVPEQQVTVLKLAELAPHYRPSLLASRTELKELIAKISTRATVAGKVAGAVLGHINQVIRIIAGAVERAGLYTKSGVPQVSARVGVMEAVG